MTAGFAGAGSPPTLFIVCGLPFSGKTTLARKIAEAANATLVSYDALWQEQMAETGRSLSWESLSALAEARLSAALTRGDSAIYDTLNDTKENRDRLKKLARSCNARALLVFVDTPLREIRARQRCNRRTRERHSVSPGNFQRALAQFQRPEPSEHALAFLPDTNPAAWLEELNRLCKTD